MVRLYPASEDSTYDFFKSRLECDFLCVEDDAGNPIGIAHSEDYGKIYFCQDREVFVPRLSAFSESQIKELRELGKDLNKFSLESLTDSFFKYGPSVCVSACFLYALFNSR